MSFGQLQLEKFGWTKGEGVGKNKSGIKRAITVTKKYDLLGVGTDRENITNNWWDKLYNNASKKIKSTSDQGSEKAEKTKQEDDGINLSKDTIDMEKSALAEPMVFNINNPDLLYHGIFVKSGGSDYSSMERYPETKEEDSEGIKFVKSVEVITETNKTLDSIENLTDEQLFAACEGRTARKGARAEQPGKLSRVSKNSGIPNPDIVKMIEMAQQGHSASMAAQINKEKEGRKYKKSSKTEEKSDLELVDKNSKDKKRKKSDKKDKKTKKDKSLKLKENDEKDNKKKKWKTNSSA
ncbi:G patch domain-containing protein 4 [Smittium culicis]|uniref:G patch domain-containing protein 4 n=1 Tax=Smittium culicis TaxID=133412 RepID=A0A1R1XUC3_9FUNG|nr:G patch domain-containing protein 4 [Smittium culicis]OMJ18231.1 G patch domain-containing protein 4 [Smittium culicis]